MTNADASIFGQAVAGLVDAVALVATAALLVWVVWWAIAGLIGLLIVAWKRRPWA